MDPFGRCFHGSFWAVLSWGRAERPAEYAPVRGESRDRIDPEGGGGVQPPQSPAESKPALAAEGHLPPSPPRRTHHSAAPASPKSSKSSPPSAKPAESKTATGCDFPAMTSFHLFTFPLLHFFTCSLVHCYFCT